MRPFVVRMLLPLAAFALVAIAFTYPLVLHLSDRLPGQVVGDNVSFLWNLWWMRRAGLGFFTTPMLFAPFGTDLALHTHTALQGAVAATLLRSLNLVTAQNIIILITLTLNGFAAYLLALDRTRDPVASWVAGLAFAGAPYVFAHLLGHFSLIGTWTIPLFTLLLLRSIERRSMVWAVSTGICLVAAAYTDYYYTVYCIVIGTALVLSGTGLTAFEADPAPLRSRVARILMALLAVVAVVAAAILITGGIDTTVAGIRVRATAPGNLLTAAWLLAIALLWMRVRPRVRGPRPGAAAVLADRARLLLPGVIVFVVGVLPVLMHAGRLWLSGDYASPPHLWRSGPGGVDLASVVIGNPLHPVSGVATRALYDRLGLDPVEGVGWLGVVLSIALVWGCVRARKERSLRRTVLGGAFFFVWSLGPWLVVAGMNSGLMLPANLFGLVPILSNARMPGRAIVVTLLAGSLLLARYLSALPTRRKLAWSSLAGVVLVAEYVPAPYPLVALDMPSIYRAIPADGTDAVLELPMGMRDGFGMVGDFDDHALVYQMFHGHPLVGGFAARLTPSIAKRYAELPLVRSLLRLSDRESSGPDERDVPMTREAAGDALRAVSVGYVVIDRSRTTAELLSFVEAKLPLELVAVEGERQLFRVEPRKP